MEPIRSPQGEAAALKAAAKSIKLPSQTSKAAALLGASIEGVGGDFESQEDQRCSALRECCSTISMPFLAAASWTNLHVGKPVKQFTRKQWTSLLQQANLFLNGLRPYYYSARVTGVNMLVMCSMWYLFVDQLRLAFFSASADFAVAIASCVVWTILVLELVGEVFIRPDGYMQMLITEKAYSPGVVRHINRFHLVMEILSLIFFVPEFLCLFTSNYTCSDRPGFSLLNATLNSVIGPSRSDAFFGRSFYAIIRLRIFGPVRHWKQMWISASIADPSLGRGKNPGRRDLIRGVLVPRTSRGKTRGSDALSQMAKDTYIKENNFKKKFSTNINDDVDAIDDKRNKREAERRKAAEQKQQDKFLTNATNIGTALMVINSHRALMLVAAIVGLLPVFSTIQVNGGTNTLASSMTKQLQATNLITPGSDANTCTFLEKSVLSWLASTSGMKQMGKLGSQTFVMYLELLPIRCPFQGEDGVVTSYFCTEDFRLKASMAKNERLDELCKVWGGTNSSTNVTDLADIAGIRTGAIDTYSEENMNNVTGTVFSVTARFNESSSIHLSNYSSFLLQFLLLIFVLSGLSVLRLDAGRLVLGPLRRMLKIVSLYAKNPLAKAPKKKSHRSIRSSGFGSDSETDVSSDEESFYGDLDHQDQLGNFETEQLISAVTKITDLLRKCWGVAGAGIISANLARQEDGLTAVFNPCVPGRMVYALFGFAAIKGFDHMLRSLGEDIMVLINDVAAVLHGECYRWGFGDSGQCNKNLGAAFLMVYRIGDAKEVKEKRDRATDVIFDSVNTEKERNLAFSVIRRRKNKRSGGAASAAALNVKRKVIKAPKNAKAETLALSSLPGISTFTDRAVLGMLKTYAGIYRDQKLLNWRDDFRLGAGVGAFSVDMIFGMDAGWVSFAITLSVFPYLLKEAGAQVDDIVTHQVEDIVTHHHITAFSPLLRP